MTDNPFNTLRVYRSRMFQNVPLRGVSRHRQHLYRSNVRALCSPPFGGHAPVGNMPQWRETNSNRRFRATSTSPAHVFSKHSSTCATLLREVTS
jgi:hypothetical protein